MPCLARVGVCRRRRRRRWRRRSRRRSVAAGASAFAHGQKQPPTVPAGPNMSAPAEKPKAEPQEGHKAFKLIEKSGMDLEALEVEGR